MSLRARLFLLFGGLIAVLGIAQWWLVRSLTLELRTEVEDVAISVGRRVLYFVSHEEGKDALLPPPPAEGTDPSQKPAKEPKLFTYRFEVQSGTVEKRIETTLKEPVTEPFQVALDPKDGDSVDRLLRIQGPGMTHSIPIPSPRMGLDEKVKVFTRNLYLGTAAILSLGVLLAALLSHRVSGPLRGLAAAARDVGGGALGTTVPESGSGEVREAIVAFNRMSAELQMLDADARALRAQEHLTEMGDIARGLAHTLRNPLNALGLSVEELAGRLRDSREASALAEAARQQIRRIDHAVRSFLVLSSEGAGAETEISLVTLIQDLEALQDARGRVRITLEEGEPPPPLHAVVAEVRAMVQALVVNAVEASPDGARVLVRIRRLDSGGALAPVALAKGARIEVDDEGPGVPEDVRKRLFAPHVSSKPHGSGLGLFLAERVAATRYHGSVALSGLTPTGTRAVLEICPRGTGSKGA